MGSRVLAQRYELLSKIGEGGMAVVFKAYDRTLGRNVALKILRPEYTKDQAFIESFIRESQLIAGIVDPNIVQVYDVGQEGNIHYIVMELVEGETLSDIIQREGRLSPKTVVSFGKQIAMALDTAHRNNLIHRDIKPHNVLVTYDGIAKLTDFGIAKRNTPSDNQSGDEKEAVMGSIHYFSPEQARGNKVDARTDIYSLGIVMYEMLTGQVPFDGESAVEVAVKHMNEPIIPPSRMVGDVPQDLEDIILKATAKKVEDRYSNAEEMIVGLNFVKLSRLCESYEDREELIIDKKYKVKQNSRAFLAMTLIILLPLVWGIYDTITGWISDINRTVTIPSVTGMTIEEATALLAKNDLTLTVAAEIIDSSVEPGTIVSQNPIEGKEVKPGYAVKVNVTKNDKEKLIPEEIIGWSLDSARTKLESLGFVIGEVTEEYSDVKAGWILSSNPAAGTLAPKGSTVNLVVSKGVDPANKTTKTVPTLTNMSLEAATQKINEIGCKVGEITYVANTSVPEGYVLKQAPDAYSEVEPGSTISLTVRTKIVPDKNVTLKVDLSKVKEKKYTITIVVTDNENNKGGVTQVNKQTYTKNGDTAEFVISGKGEGTALVTIGSNMYKYTVNFDTGAVSLN